MLPSGTSSCQLQYQDHAHFSQLCNALSVPMSRSVKYFLVEETILKVWFILGTPFNFSSDNYIFPFNCIILSKSMLLLVVNTGI